MSRISVALLLCALLLPAAAGADTSKLSKSYDLTLGDVVARRVADLLALRPEMADAPVLASYEPDKKVLELTVAGGRTEVEQAKGALDKLAKMLDDKILPVVNKSFGVSLNNADFTLVYVNRKQGKEIVRREGGKFLVP